MASNKKPFATTNGVTSILRIATYSEIRAAIEEETDEYGKDRDGCEWCPEHNRPAESDDTHYHTAAAEVMIGANVAFRVCLDCSKLPRFNRFRVRKAIRRKRAMK